MRNILILLAGLAVVAIVGVGLYQWLGAPGPATSVTPAPPSEQAPLAGGRDGGPATAADSATVPPAEIREDDYVVGNREAPVVLIEYASLTCPHCRRLHLEAIPQLKEAYAEGGKVALVYRDFPLDGWALRAAMLARCVGRERYFGFLELLYKRQPAWTTAQDPMAALRRLAALGGMDDAAVDSCLANEQRQRAVIEERVEGAEAFGINSTPSFVINGRLHKEEANFETLKSAIESALAEAG